MLLPINILYKQNGYTFAVLGSGIDVIYPYVNKTIYYKLLEGGGIISEFPPGTKNLIPIISFKK